MAVLLDTCAAIWLMAGDPFSEGALQAIQQAQTTHLGIYVSAFTAWELATLVSKGRVQLTITPQSWFARLTALPGMRLADVTPEILIASTQLPGVIPQDPADRIIAATARALDLTLITRDRKLLSYAEQGHLRAICC